MCPVFFSLSRARQTRADTVKLPAATLEAPLRGAVVIWTSPSICRKRCALASASGTSPAHVCMRPTAHACRHSPAPDVTHHTPSGVRRIPVLLVHLVTSSSTSSPSHCQPRCPCSLPCSFSSHPSYPPPTRQPTVLMVVDGAPSSVSAAPVVLPTPASPSMPVHITFPAAAVPSAEDALSPESQPPRDGWRPDRGGFDGAKAEKFLMCLSSMDLRIVMRVLDVFGTAVSGQSSADDPSSIWMPNNADQCGHRGPHQICRILYNQAQFDI